jgi:predicted Ser/Thr protein kinase
MEGEYRQKPGAVYPLLQVLGAMLTSLTVEHELGKAGVDVVYANEPVGGTESGRLRTAATARSTRRSIEPR